MRRTSGLTFSKSPSQSSPPGAAPFAPTALWSGECARQRRRGKALQNRLQITSKRISARGKSQSRQSAFGSRCLQPPLPFLESPSIAVSQEPRGSSAVPFVLISQNRCIVRPIFIYALVRLSSSQRASAWISTVVSYMAHRSLCLDLAHVCVCHVCVCASGEADVAWRSLLSDLTSTRRL